MPPGQIWVPDNLRKAVKARDLYGLVFDDVKKMQAMKHLREAEAGPNPPPPGTRTENSTVSNESAVVPYTDTSLMTRAVQNNTQNQLANIVKKVPTMPKPKWHPPWKLFRVIAGHLGWVRCVAVEPGNEVRFQLVKIANNCFGCSGLLQERQIEL